MLNTIITATTIITGITGTTLGIKAAVTDRRQNKTLNTLNESLKKFDERMKTIESDCHAMAPAVQQLLAIMQPAPQPAEQPAPQPAPVAAAPAQAEEPAPQPAPQQAEQPTAAPAAQHQQATTTVQVDQPEEAPAVESTQEPATKQKAPETQPKTPATKTGANKKNTKKEVNTNAMPAAVVAAK